MLEAVGWPLALMEAGAAVDGDGTQLAAFIGQAVVVGDLGPDHVVIECRLKGDPASFVVVRRWG